LVFGIILVLWKPAFFGVKPDLIIKQGTIIGAAMGDPNASIPTHEPVHYRPMFGHFGRSLTMNAVTFVSQAALEAQIADSLGLQIHVTHSASTSLRINPKAKSEKT
jgi:urease subunit alpha